MDRGLRERIDVDLATMRATEVSVPRCPECGTIARPNMMLFDDDDFVWQHLTPQVEAKDAWLVAAINAPGVVVEIGAGTAVPAVRDFGVQVSASHGWPLIRINPREPDASGEHDVALQLGALDALTQIDALMKGTN
jgi:NAD-dependent SIR2 family protein deacetylase